MDKKIEIIRRIVYSLCFFFLCIINWGASTLDGRIQFVMTNSTGLVMAVIILSGYRIKDFIKPVYAIWTGVITIGMPFVIFWGLRNYPYKGQWISGSVNVCIYGYIVIAILCKNIVEKKYSGVKWPVFICWLVMIIYMVLSRNEAIWPLWFGGMFGSYYLTDYTVEKESLILESLICGIIAGFVVIQGGALLFRPYDSVRYLGLFLNPNINASMYVLTYAAFLGAWYILKKKDTHISLRMIAALLSGSMWGFVLLTGCRSGFVALFLITVPFCICMVRHKSYRRFVSVLKYPLIVFGMAVLSFPLVYGAARYVPTIHLHPIFFGDEYNDWNKIHSDEPWSSEKYITIEELIDNNIGQKMKDLIKVDALDIWNSMPQVIVAYAANEDVPEQEYIITSGEDLTGFNVRYQIYKWYFCQLNVFGHKNSEHGAPIVDWYSAPHSHNWWLQMTFNFGIPVGILLIAGVVMYIITFFDLLRKGEDVSACIMGCFVVAFIAFGMFEANYSLGQLPFTMFFFMFREVVRKRETVL